MTQICLLFCAGKRKIHYLFTDGKEMAEEYDLKTDELLGKPHVLSSTQLNGAVNFYSFMHWSSLCLIKHLIHFSEKMAP